MYKFISFALVIGCIMVFGSSNLLAAEANDAEMHYFLGIEYYMHKQYYDATLEFGEAIMLKPDYAEAESAFKVAYAKLKENDAEESREQKAERPPLSPIRISGEILAGGAGGIALGIVSGFVGLFVDVVNLSLDAGTLESAPAATVGFIIGYVLGSAISVYIVGNMGNETGSFLATLGGSILLVPLPLLSPIGATIGFNLTRRYKSPPASETALVNFREGQISLAVPTIYLRPNPFDRRNLIQNVDLVKVRF